MKAGGCERSLDIGSLRVASRWTRHPAQLASRHESHGAPWAATVMVLATFTDSVAFQLAYPLAVIPPSAWYGHWYTAHRVPPPQPQAPPPPRNAGPSTS